MITTEAKKSKFKTSNLEDFDSKSYVYFTQEHQQAVLDFIDEKIPESTRFKIYNEILYPAFEEMIKIMINTFDFRYTGFDEEFLIIEVHNHIYEALNKAQFNDDRGSAYTYFSRVIKNFLIQKQKKNQDLLRKYGMYSVNDDENYYQETLYYNEDEFDFRKFYSDFVLWLDKYKHEFIEKDKEDEKKIIENILRIMKEDDIIINNKKIFLIIIRQLTNQENYKINKIINKIKERYVKILSFYCDNNYINMNDNYIK